MATKREVEYYKVNKELIDKATLEGIELAGDELVKSGILQHYVAACLTDKTILDGVSPQSNEYDEKIRDIVGLSIDSLMEEGKLVPNEQSTLREPVIMKPIGLIEPEQKKLHFAIVTVLNDLEFKNKVQNGEFVVENNNYIDTENCLLRPTHPVFFMKEKEDKAACVLPNRVCIAPSDYSEYQTIYEMEMECKNGVIFGDVHVLMEVVAPSYDTMEEFKQYEPPVNITKGGNLGYCEANYLAAYGVAPVLKNIEPSADMIISTDKKKINEFIRSHRRQKKLSNVMIDDKKDIKMNTIKK